MSQIGDARDNVAVADRQIDDTRDDNMLCHSTIHTTIPFIALTAVATSVYIVDPRVTDHLSIVPTTRG